MLLEILGLIGAICLFLYGMRVVSDALQKLSGKRMRSVINKLTNTRLRGFFSGFFLTSLIQTSSASTILIVSLVNAGVISLAASLPMIIGANVGTTIKLWLISFLGFHFDIGSYALVLIAFGFPFLFFKRTNWKKTGEFLIGFALLFMGLYYMKSVFPDAGQDSVFYQWVQNTSQSGFLGVLLFVVLGFLITAIIQSSSAAITLTFVLCYHGVIDFNMAAAMVLGQNIGTTITVNIAALVGGINAKRSALSHLLMNLIAVIMVLPFFKLLTGLSIIAVKQLFNADMTVTVDIPIGITFFHTAFNLLLALVMLPLARYIVKLTEIVLPLKGKDKQKLRLLEDNFFSTSEMSVLHAKTEIIRFALQVKKMLNRLPALLLEKKEKKFLEIFEKMVQIKETAYLNKSEINEYLSKISEKDISADSSRKIIKMIDISDHLESMSVEVFNFAKIIERKNQQNAWFNQEMRDSVFHCFELINEATEMMIDSISNDSESQNGTSEKLDEIVLFISETRNFSEKLKREDEAPEDSLQCFNQMLDVCEHIAQKIVIL